jgi:hypothetical protein
MKRHFTIELASIDPGGAPGDLMKDLMIDGVKRLRRLNHLTDDFLYTAQKLNWPDEAEGSWILVPLGSDLAICQWDPGDEALWRLGLAVGCLKVVRILRKADLSSFIASGDDAEHADDQKI